MFPQQCYTAVSQGSSNIYEDIVDLCIMASDTTCSGLDSTGLLFILVENCEQKEMALLPNFILIYQNNSIFMLTKQFCLFSFSFEKITKQEQHWNKSLFVPDEAYFRIFISQYNLFIKCHSLALWGELHTTVHAGDEIVHSKSALADKCYLIVSVSVNGKSK